jgi:hypothetical protein
MARCLSKELLEATLCPDTVTRVPVHIRLWLRVMMVNTISSGWQEGVNTVRAKAWPAV